MKLFITDVYKIFYRIIGRREPAILLAIAYTSALNLLTLYGLAFLLKSAIPLLGYMLKLFATPYYFFTVAAMLAFNYWLLTPFSDLAKTKKIKPFVAPIIVYSCVAIMLFLCGRFMDSVKF